MIHSEAVTVLITGASRGLGLELTKRFLQQKSFEVVAATRNAKALKLNLNEHIVSRHLHIVSCDITEASGRDYLADRVAELPKLKYVIHNAGALVYKSFEEITASDLQEVFSVNFFAPFLLTKRLLPLMHQCHSIFISSVGGVQGSVKYSGLSAYSSSKAAVNILTEILAEEFKALDHVFNCLALGSVETEMFRKAFPEATASSNAADMANYIYSFATEAAGVINGQVISVTKSNP